MDEGGVVTKVMWDEIDWESGWSVGIHNPYDKKRWLHPNFHPRYSLRDQGDKTWAVVDRATREVLVKGLKRKEAEGFMKLLKEE